MKKKFLNNLLVIYMYLYLTYKLFFMKLTGGKIKPYTFYNTDKKYEIFLETPNNTLGKKSHEILLSNKKDSL